jgi:5-methylcytosine-specific restriction endonuclease McrA
MTYTPFIPYFFPFTDADEQTKRNVWNLGRPIQGYDQDTWRIDVCGHTMKYQDHGNTNSEYGWEIDHIMPVALGGTNVWDNLQPLYWENNRKKGNNYPWSCI